MKDSSLKRNLIYNIIYQILIIALPLITAPYISRILGPTGIGTYSYSYSIVTYFGLIGMLGISNHGIREISSVKNKNDKDELGKKFINIYIIQLTTTLFVIFCYIIYIIFFCKHNVVIFIIQIITLMGCVFDISWLYLGLENFKSIVIKNIFVKFFSVLSIFIFVKEIDDLWKYTLIMACTTLMSRIIFWGKIKQILHFVKPDISCVKSNIKPVLVLFVSTLAYSIYKIMDKIMLGTFTNMDQLGYYENAEKIINIAIGVLNAISAVLFPRISSILSNNKEYDIKKYIEKSFRYLSIIMCSLAFGFIGISNTFTVIYYGENFRLSGELLKYLSVCLIFITWANIIRSQYLMPNKKDKIYVYSTIYGAIINLILNSIFIKIYGAMGAVFGTIIAEFTVLLVQILYVYKKIPVLRYILSSMPIVFIGLLMALIVRYIGEINETTIKTLIVQICTGASIYLLLILIFLIIVKDDILVFIHLKKNKKN